MGGRERATDRGRRASGARRARRGLARRVLLGVLLSSALALLASAGPARSAVVLLLADGLRVESYERLLSQGRLPNIQRHFVARGTSVGVTTSVYPSTTGPAYAPLVCGLFPRKAGLPGIRWFDRQRGISRVYCGTDFARINDDLTTEFKTIFELLPPDESVSVMGIVDRGCRDRINSMLDIAPDKISGDFTGMDDTLFERYLAYLQGRASLPQFSFVTLHGPDSYGHSVGPLTADYDRSVVEIDAKIGRLAEALDRLGLRETTHLILTSDHGQAPTARHEDLGAWLAGRLGATVRGPFKKTPAFFNARSAAERADFDMHLEVSGNNCVQIYLRGGVGGAPLRAPRIRSFVEDLGLAASESLEEALLANEAVDLLFMRAGPGETRVVSRSGEGLLRASARDLSWEVVSGEDPLGYASQPQAAALMDGRAHDADAWFAATEGTRYPDALLHVADLMGSERSGDVLVQARPGWEPWDEGQAGVHGGLGRDEFCVPLVVAGPGVAVQRLPRARTADVFPTVCRLLGLDVPEGIDGRELPVLAAAHGPVAAYREALRAFEAAEVAAFLGEGQGSPAAQARSDEALEAAEAARATVVDAVAAEVRGGLPAPGRSPTLEALLRLAAADLASWYDAVEALEGLAPARLGAADGERVARAVGGLDRDAPSLARELARTAAAVARCRGALDGAGPEGVAPQVDYLSLLRRQDALEQFFTRRVAAELRRGSTAALALLVERGTDPDFRQRLTASVQGLRGETRPDAFAAAVELLTRGRRR